ncbi:MAG: hypothetical protein MK160_01915 [Rhodobacteraceae bacterium]|nr:hypothetical protein [Paracoccaceae bacterium]
MALRTLAWQAKWRGALNEAENKCHQGLARLRGENAGDAMADCYSILGVISYSRRDLTGARDHVRDGFSCLSENSAVASRIDLLATRANIERYSGRLDRAYACLTEAMSLANGAELARLEHNIARATLQDGYPQQSLEHSESALMLAQKFNNRVILPYAFETMGAALIDVGQADRALDPLSRGLAVARDEQDHRVECQLLHEICRVHMAQQEFKTGLPLAVGGQKTARDMGYTLWETKFLELVAYFQDQLGQTEAALQSFKALVQMRGNNPT